MPDNKDVRPTGERWCYEATKAVTDLIGQDDVRLFADHLNEMFVGFVATNDLSSPQFKENIVYTYTVLRDHLKSLEILQQDRKKL